MKLLELFSGTGSVGKYARILNIEVTSLDRDLPADIQKDIMDWDYKAAFEPKHFDVIWASPPCTVYSVAKTIGVRDIEGSNQVVQRTLDIISYLQPKFWVLENPQTGKLKEQVMMQNLPFDDVDYCKYGMPYRKRTRLWNNIDEWTPRPLCNRDCPSMNETRTRHNEIAQRGPGKAHIENRQRLTQLYIVPVELIRDILIKIRILTLTL